jgi:hypothetical protein
MGFTTPAPQLPQERAAEVEARAQQLLPLYQNQQTVDFTAKRTAYETAKQAYLDNPTPENLAKAQQTKAEFKEARYVPSGRMSAGNHPLMIDPVTNGPVYRSDKEISEAGKRRTLYEAGDLPNNPNRRQRAEESKRLAGAAALARRTGLPMGSSYDQMVEDELARRQRAQDQAAFAAVFGNLPQGATPETVSSLGAQYRQMFPPSQVQTNGPQVTPEGAIVQPPQSDVADMAAQYPTYEQLMQHLEEQGYNSDQAHAVARRAFPDNLRDNPPPSAYWPAIEHGFRSLPEGITGTQPPPPIANPTKPTPPGYKPSLPATPPKGRIRSAYDAYGEKLNRRLDADPLPGTGYLDWLLSNFVTEPKLALPTKPRRAGR